MPLRTLMVTIWSLSNMKRLHKQNLFCWSEFDEDRNIDFHSYLWVRDEGNVVIDPLPLTEHDKSGARAAQLTR